MSSAADLFCAGRSLLPVQEPRPGGIALLQLPPPTPWVQNGRQAIFLAESLTALRAGKACNVSQAVPLPKKTTTVYSERNENSFPRADSESAEGAVAMLTVDGWHISHMNNICQNSFQWKLLKHREVV